MNVAAHTPACQHGERCPPYVSINLKGDEITLSVRGSEPQPGVEGPYAQISMKESEFVSLMESAVLRLSGSYTTGTDVESPALSEFEGWAKRGVAILRTLVEAVGTLPENARGTVNGQALNRAYEMACDYVQDGTPK